MLKMPLYLILVTLFFYHADCAQPYFPQQIVFSPDNGGSILAIDEPNQRAYKLLHYGAAGEETSYVMKTFPYTVPDSPQSKSYVQLLKDSVPLGCMFGTYWKYGGNTFNSFPSHWSNGTSFTVRNYIQFRYEMIHSMNSSLDEDYWYANATCEVDSGETYPCEEIYFQKDTEIPLRFTQVVRRGWTVIQVVTNYQIMSMGKPDDKYFDSIPKDWFLTCRDVMMGLLYYPQTSKLSVKQSSEVQLWLITPPHRINDNDTVTIQWKATECVDCLTWTPKELSFNSKNFQEKQILTITRVKDGPKTTLIPSFNGGGFDLISPVLYSIYVE